MERRTFVLATGGLLGCPGLARAATLTPARVAPAAGLRAASFTALLNQTFNVYDHRHGGAMALVAVRACPAAAGHEQFSLTFAAPGATFNSGSYQVEHAAIGMLTLYLQASGTGPQGALYRADFNLLG